MLKDVILIVDTKTLEWLKGKSRDEMIGFALNSCKIIADDVWTKIESWIQKSVRCHQSLICLVLGIQVNVQRLFTKQKKYKNLAIADRTGTTGFGGKIAVALCMDD